MPQIYTAFASEVKVNEETIEGLHHLVRKLGHLTEYAILGVLVWRALHQSKTDLPEWSWPRVGGGYFLNQHRRWSES